VPWRESADRVGLQPDGVMGRPDSCSPETIWGKPAHENVHATHPQSGSMTTRYLLPFQKRAASVTVSVLAFGPVPASA